MMSILLFGILQWRIENGDEKVHENLKERISLCVLLFLPRIHAKRQAKHQRRTKKDSKKTNDYSENLS
jgi:hypothetical protein